MKEFKILAIIPARGGSKGIPRKNIKPLFGKPLIAYTIETALKCKNLNRIVVSTEDAEIATIAKKYGADVPFLRPKELATDTAPTVPVLRHVVRELEAKGEHYDAIILLEPTAPLRAQKDIEEAIRLIAEPGVDSVVGVCAYEVDPSDIMLLQSDGHIKPYFDEGGAGRRQSTKNLVKLNAAIYAVKKDVLMDEKTKFLNPWGGQKDMKTKIVLMPKERSVEIDEPLDFEFVEFLMKKTTEKGEYHG